MLKVVCDSIDKLRKKRGGANEVYEEVVGWDEFYNVDTRLAPLLLE